MLEGKKIVIFDLDGTLLDTVGIWNQVDEKLIRTIGDGSIDEVNITKQRDEQLRRFNRRSGYVSCLL